MLRQSTIINFAVSQGTGKERAGINVLGNPKSYICRGPVRTQVIRRNAMYKIGVTLIRSSPIF